MTAAVCRSPIGTSPVVEEGDPMQGRRLWTIPVGAREKSAEAHRLPPLADWSVEVAVHARRERSREATLVQFEARRSGRNRDWFLPFCQY